MTRLGAALLFAFLLLPASASSQPIAIFDADPNPAACGQSVTFDGSGSTHGDPLRSLVDWAWDFDDGGSVSGASPIVSHSFDAFGQYTVELTVTDDDSPPQQDSTTLVVDVSLGNIPPVADSGGPYVGEVGGDVLLDASGSFDPDAGCGDSIVLYEWDLDNDGTFDASSPSSTLLLSWSQIESLGLAFPADAGTGLPTNSILLRVTDSFGSTDTLSTTLTIYVNEPVAAFIASPNPAACSQTITFDASASTHGDPSHSIVGYDWDFGDGQFGSGEVVMHAYDLFGPYTAMLTVTDDNAPSRTDSTMLGIAVDQGNLPPISNANGPYLMIRLGRVTLDGSGSIDPDIACGDAIVFYEWDVGGDGTFDFANVTSTLDVSWFDLELLGLGQVGELEIVLRVTDGFGETGVDATTLSIELPPVPALGVLGRAAAAACLALAGGLALRRHRSN